MQHRIVCGADKALPLNRQLSVQHSYIFGPYYDDDSALALAVICYRFFHFSGVRVEQRFSRGVLKSRLFTCSVEITANCMLLVGIITSQTLYSQLLKKVRSLYWFDINSQSHMTSAIYAANQLQADSLAPGNCSNIFSNLACSIGYCADPIRALKFPIQLDRLQSNRKHSGSQHNPVTSHKSAKKLG